MPNSLVHSSNYVSLLLLIAICRLVPCSCSQTTNLDKITSCFLGHNIGNFTLHSSTNVSAYFDLLNFSLQNLRFSDISFSKPSAIIVPKSKQEISSIVLCCRQWSFDIRIRSGGHSYEGISSSSSSASTSNDTKTVVSAPFVVIDMMSLDKISVDLKSETAWVEGGATVGQTYCAIAELSNVHGFPAGACPTVGVGGHFSGGGYGFLGRKYGVAADHVVDALLVDARGRILNRDAMGEDVFWAIRGGGGGNWGIVLAWKIRLVKVPEIVTALSVARPQHTIEKTIQEFQNVVHDLDDRFHVMVLVTFGLNLEDKETAVIFQGLYQGPRSEALSILTNSFPSMEIREEECKEMSWIRSVDYLSDISGGQGSISSLRERYFQDKAYFKAKSDYVRKPLPSVGIKTLIDFLRKTPKASALFEPYGGFMEKTKSDAIAFPHRKGNIFSIEYTITWDETDDRSGESKRHINWLRRFYNAMAPYVSSNPRAAYVNYIDLDLGEVTDISSSTARDPVDSARAWGEKYFLKNYERLVMAKTIIDPQNVFRHQQSLPPMITYKSEY